MILIKELGIKGSQKDFPQSKDSLSMQEESISFETVRQGK